MTHILSLKSTLLIIYLITVLKLNETPNTKRREYILVVFLRVNPL